MKVATIGFFDGVHSGHQFLIRQLCEAARQRGAQSLVVSFNTSPVAVIRGKADVKLLTPKQEKLELLTALGIDEVNMYDFNQQLASMSAYDFMHQVLHDNLGVTTLLIGYDHQFGCSNKGRDYEAYGRELGIEILHVQASGNASSSAIRTLLQQGDILTANQLLGYDYRIQGVVIPGRQVGRTIGFPTANIQVPPTKLLPALGAYEVTVHIETLPNHPYRGMLNIGRDSIEVHILDFSGDLYGRTLVLTLNSRIRDEIDFPDLSSLRLQLTHDLQALKS